MNKELEALEKLDNTLCLNNIKGNIEFGIDTEEHSDCNNVIEMTECLEDVRNNLLELQTIKEANPSEALGKLEGLYSNVTEEIYWHWKGYECCKEEVHKYDDDFKYIKQSLLKAQQQEQELAKYKQLEKEIGCPLDVVLKLVNQNELYYQFYNELQHWTSVKVDLRKKVVWYCKQVGGHYACSQPLSNYGKTFWLKEDKSE